MQLTAEYISFLQLHEQQLNTSRIPKYFWKTLYSKLTNSVLNIGQDFTLLKIDYDDDRNPEDPVYIIQVTCDEGINYKEEEHIYLVDHAWTFRTEHVRENLNNIETLLNRMCNLMGVESTCTKDQRIDKVGNLMWKYCQTYSISNAATVEDRLPIWYVMDEVGSAIVHSDEPNFRAVPFVFFPENITYTVIFPIKNLENGDFVMRDFAEGISDSELRKASLLPWKPNLFLDDYKQMEPNEEYFLSGHIAESLPSAVRDSVDEKPILKVFTEYGLVAEYLTRTDKFILTNDENSADILWYTRHFTNYADLSSDTFVNQFPYENVLTIKDLLSIICRRKSVDGKYPSWLPITYNLKTELCKFISYYQHREEAKEDNYWICKPWNLARGLDTHITSNLDYIIRLASAGPPKIVQKYITNPVLFNRPECGGKVKFDIRYVILLKSVHPLKVYIYKNFFIRFSNKAFELKDFFDYEKHFTVMNYNENAVLKHMLCAEFVEEWKEQYPDYSWEEVENNILVALRETFEAAMEQPPPKGIAASPSSRAVYAADLMLEWDDTKSKPCIQPKLLEMNWIPDCKRACNYYPEFYNKIFGLLFLDEDDDIFKEF